jgi:hypothetical protein
VGKIAVWDSSKVSAAVESADPFNMSRLAMTHARRLYDSPIFLPQLEDFGIKPAV